MARVWLDEMAAVVEDDVPTARSSGMALDVAYKQRLGEIVAVEDSRPVALIGPRAA